MKDHDSFLLSAVSDKGLPLSSVLCGMKLCLSLLSKMRLKVLLLVAGWWFK